MGEILNTEENIREKTCDDILDIIFPILQSDTSLLSLFDGCIDKYVKTFESASFGFGIRFLFHPVGKDFIDLYYKNRPIEKTVNDFYEKIIASIPDKELSSETISRLKKWIDYIHSQSNECPEMSTSIDNMINIIEDNIDNENYISQILEVLAYALENCVFQFAIESRLLNIIINKILFSNPMVSFKENTISNCYRILICIFKNNPYDVSMDILRPFIDLHWDGKPGDINIKDINIRSSKDHSGLRNLGSTCYANSLLQQLYHIEPIRESILSITLSSIEKTVYYSIYYKIGRK